MAVDPTVQAQLDGANATARLGIGYQVTALIGEKTVTWRSANKIDLRDTLTVAVNESAFVTASVSIVAT